VTAIPEGAGNGSVLVPDRSGLATLVVRRFLRHPPNVVWRAITDPDEVRKWFLTELDLEARPGGRIETTTGNFRVHSTGRVLAWDPPRVYEYEWNVTPSPSLPEGEITVVRWELSPADGGTLLTVTHRGLTRRTAGVFGEGMEAFLDRLEAQLDGRPLPDWETRLREIRGGTSGWNKR
jgi:uncharacterized protein YndB with AHSA1/START domain